MKRRTFLQTVVAACTAPALAATLPFRLRYVLSSALYGEMPLEQILPEVAKTGCEAIDIWCKVHGNQREQIAAMGNDACAALLKQHNVKLGVSTRYPLGPFGLQEELAWVKQLGGEMVVTGSDRGSDPAGKEAKSAIRNFLEKMKPHVARAEELGVTIAIENHGNQTLYHPDSLLYFAEMNRSDRLGIAFAPHHLHPWQSRIPTLIRDLGAQQIAFLYFQEYSEGMIKQTSKPIEMRQLPGFGGSLDYPALLQALRDIDYEGYVEIFMHPTPRGIPILPTVAEVSAAVIKARSFITTCGT